MDRPKVEIIRAANTLRDQAQDLPEWNEEGRNELMELSRDLYSVAGGLEPNSDAVERWLNFEPSEIDDCL